MNLTYLLERTLTYFILLEADAFRRSLLVAIVIWSQMTAQYRSSPPKKDAPSALFGRRGA